MFDLILERLAEKRESIKRKLELLNNLTKANKINIWKKYLPKLCNLPKSLGAVDGGSVTIPFKGFILYCVSSIGLNHELRNSTYKLSSKFPYVDVDVLLPSFALERVDTYREILEGRAALSCIMQGSEIVLIDGSLASILIGPRPVRVRGVEELIVLIKNLFGNKIFDKLSDNLEYNITNNINSIVSKDIIDEYILERGQVIEEEYEDAIGMLEYLEKLLIYKRLLKESKHESKIVFISKTSRSNWLFNLPVPDMYVIEKVFSSPGRTEHIIRGVPEIKGIPRVLYLREFFEEILIVHFYIRVKRGGPVLKIEVPIHKGKECPYEEIMDILYYLSADGYPYPLLYAHKYAHIDRKNLINVIESLDMGLELTGREVVGEWSLKSLVG